MQFVVINSLIDLFTSKELLEASNILYYKIMTTLKLTNYSIDILYA